MTAAGRAPVNVTQTIELMNYATGNFEQIDTRSSAVVDTIVNIKIAGDLTRFIRPENNCMEAKLTFSKTGLARGLQILVDQAVWQTTNK